MPSANGNASVAYARNAASAQIVATGRNAANAQIVATGRSAGTAATAREADAAAVAAAAAETSPFDKGLKPDRIIGATAVLGDLTFLIKFHRESGAVLVPARIANVKCPQIVIGFYEKHLRWVPDDSDDADL